MISYVENNLNVIAVPALFGPLIARNAEGIRSGVRYKVEMPEQDRHVSVLDGWDCREDFPVAGGVPLLA